MIKRWADCPRQELTDCLPRGLVVLAIGAVEQHGPHLPTGTDALVVTSLVNRAAELAGDRCPGDVILAPEVAVGVSAHHVPFGGTLSLSPATMLGLLGDLFDSIAAAGASRLLVVNGHGGNSGILRAAAGAAGARTRMKVACLDYWALLPSSPTMPGHAGEFETALVLALMPDRVRDTPTRDQAPTYPAVRGAEVHTQEGWATMDGFSDLPHRAGKEAGDGFFRDLADALAETIVTAAAL
ncbi:creatininase family protein [Kribbella sp. NPDC003505]|uniref:creatininase family protein n=1 Tax=Kribbella sp. NPDC003505 TaxID=3154448 RepID=UPI0033B66404